MSYTMSQRDSEIMRAKLQGSGEWVYGDNTKPLTTHGKPISVYLVYGDTDYLVLYHTIGRSVGVDKIGDLIFENDIVKTKDGIGTIEWDNDASQVVIKFEHFTVGFEHYKSLGIEMELVGNTFDGITEDGGGNI